jgi:molecular chaperone DnaJ
MPKRKSHEILKVSENATQPEIKKAYHKLALEWHPDKHPENKKNEVEEKMKEINEAYEILTNSKNSIASSSTASTQA